MRPCNASGRCARPARRKRARQSPTSPQHKATWVRVTHVTHGKEDGRGTTASVRECEEIGQMKTANHLEVTRTKVWRSHGDDGTRQSRRGRRYVRSTSV